MEVKHLHTVVQALCLLRQHGGYPRGNHRRNWWRSLAKKFLFLILLLPGSVFSCQIQMLLSVATQYGGNRETSADTLIADKEERKDLSPQCPDLIRWPLRNCCWHGDGEVRRVEDIVSRSCWCAQAGHQISLCVEHMACCLLLVPCAPMSIVCPSCLVN